MHQTGELVPAGREPRLSLGKGVPVRLDLAGSSPLFKEVQIQMGQLSVWKPPHFVVRGACADTLQRISPIRIIQSRVYIRGLCIEEILNAQNTPHPKRRVATNQTVEVFVPTVAHLSLSRNAWWCPPLDWPVNINSHARDSLSVVQYLADGDTHTL